MDQLKNTLTHAPLRENDFWGRSLRRNDLIDESESLSTFEANQSRYIESPLLEDIFTEVTTGISLRGQARPHRRLAVLSLLNACFEAVHSSSDGPVGVLWRTSTSVVQQAPRLFSPKARKPAAEHLERYGYIHFKKGGKQADGFMPGVVSLAFPTEKLYRLYEEVIDNDYTVLQLAEADGDLIVLKDKQKQLLAFEDTEATLRDREHLREMNAVNHHHSWCYINNKDEVIPLSPWSLTLKRHFLHSDLKTFGRIQCTAQSALRKRDRRSLLIDGEETTELDYQSMQVALAYGEAGKQGFDLSGCDQKVDPYALPGYNRAAVKLAVSVMLNTESRRSAVQALSGLKLHDPTEKGDGRAIDYLLDAIIQKHPVLQPYLFDASWRTLIYAESTIMMELLNHCRGYKIPVLPVHDCLICKVSDRDRVIQFMKHVFEREYGFTPTICETVGSSGKGMVVESADRGCSPPTSRRN